MSASDVEKGKHIYESVAEEWVRQHRDGGGAEVVEFIRERTEDR